ncbi:MAG: efflux RND transporter periplasmic adaptor subunit [Phycisphaerales bacterium]
MCGLVRIGGVTTARTGLAGLGLNVIRILIVLAVVLAVLVGGVFAVWKSPVGDQIRAKQAEGEQGELVRMEIVGTGDIVRTVSAPGSIEPRTNVQISSQVSARVLALPFREGEMVQTGDVVIRLDPQDLVAILDSAKAGLRGQEARLGGSEARLINARLEFERLRSLFETGDVTKSELDVSEANYLQAQSDKQALEHGIDQAQAQIDQAEQDLANTTIVSPIDGVITSLNAEVGETVIVGTTNNPGSVIMEIADLSDMLLRAAVDEANIAPVEVGQEATVYINAYSDREYKGSVRRIGLKRQVSSDGTGTFEVEIALELAEGETLFSGLSASTDIAVERVFDAIRVPTQAVLDRRVDDLPLDIRTGNELVDTNKTFARVVYKVVDGKTIVTPVRVGASDLTGSQILEGLAEGDEIVTGPFRVLVNLKNDQAVRDEVKVEAEKKAEEARKAAEGSDGETRENVDDTAGGSTEGETTDAQDSDAANAGEG